MHVRVKLYALLDKYLPAGSASGPTGNEADLEFSGDATVATVLKHLKVPSEHCHLVLVNGLFVPPGEREKWSLADGDHLAVWPPVAGG